MKWTACLIGTIAVFGTAAVNAADETASLAVYSARGYSSDEALYTAFMEKTGVQIARTENSPDGILSILEAQGAGSRADVVLLNGVTDLMQAQSKGLLRPTKSKMLNSAVSAQFRAAPDANGGTAWYGLALRPRVIVYNKAQIKPEAISTYQALADPQHKGKVCLGSTTLPANLSLFGALIEHLGAAKTQAWLQDVAANLARPAGGNDTEQIKAVAAGVCQIGLINSFELTRLLRSDQSEDRSLTRTVAVVFPNQGSWGTHVDVGGAAVARHAPHPQQAVQFLQFLASAEGQNRFANTNDEWPVVRKFRFDNPQLKAIGATRAKIKIDTTALAKIGAHHAQVVHMLEQVGLSK